MEYDDKIQNIQKSTLTPYSCFIDSSLNSVLSILKTTMLDIYRLPAIRVTMV